ADDHAVPVVLEALRGVDAPHLLEASRVRRPERGRWCACHGAVALEVPRAGPVTDLDVMDQPAVLGRVAPGPAEAGRHPRRPALVVVCAKAALELLDRVHDVDHEVRLVVPVERRGLAVDLVGEAEEVMYPREVVRAATRAELGVEVDLA